jgi:hypothetical protein
LSKDLSMKDLERLIRRFTSLSKKHEVPSSCRVEPYSASHALPQVSTLFSVNYSCFLSTAPTFLEFLVACLLLLDFILCRTTKFSFLCPLYLKVEK